MANVLRPLLDDEDERALLRFLAQTPYEVYPRRVPPDWKPFIAGPECTTGCLRSSTSPRPIWGAVLVDRVKRGPDKGTWRVDEVRSPVVFWERSQPDEDGALRRGSSGPNWT